MKTSFGGASCSFHGGAGGGGYYAAPLARFYHEGGQRTRSRMVQRCSVQQGSQQQEGAYHQRPGAPSSTPPPSSSAPASHCSSWGGGRTRGPEHHRRRWQPCDGTRREQQGGHWCATACTNAHKMAHNAERDGWGGVGGGVCPGPNVVQAWSWQGGEWFERGAGGGGHPTQLGLPSVRCFYLPSRAAVWFGFWPAIKNQIVST